MQRSTKLSRSINGNICLITGAASGIGLASAYLLADEGATVCVTDTDQTQVDTVVGKIREGGGTAYGWALNVTHAKQIEFVTQEILATFGQLDCLINNAGVSLFSKIDADDYELKWSQSIDALLTAHVRMIRASLPLLRQSAHPRIVNVASTEGMGATAFGSPYTAAKHGVIGLTRSLAVELGPENITVNCVCPGPVNTGMTANLSDDDKLLFAKRRTALRRYAEPEEIAHGILNLLLPASQYITGVALPIDGGLSIRNA